MPSTRKQSDTTDYFSHPTRRATELRGGLRPPAAGHIGSPDILCIQLVDFWGIVLDYEGMAVFYDRRRHLLKLREFRFLEALLWAEDEGVLVPRLADACGVPPHRFQRDLLNRISYRLRRQVLVNQEVGVLESSGDLWRIKRPSLPLP